jgi:hypothetical protein
MREAEQLKLELISLSESLKSFIETNRTKMSSKSVLIHDLRDIGFTKIGTSKWALDLKLHDVSYVSFMLVFRGTSVDITEDHMVVKDGVEMPSSNIEKPFTMTSVRYGRVVQELLKRTKELTEIFRKRVEDE